MTSSNFALPFIAVLFCGLAGCASDETAQIAPPAEAASNAAISNPGNLDDDIRHAQLQRTSHDLDGATRTLSQLMLMAPDDPRVVGEYGKVLAEKGRAREAVEFLTRATQLRSNDWSIYSALGVAEDQLGKQQEARAAYEQALALQPGEPSVLSNYALSRLLANDPTTARRLMAMAAAHGGASDPQIARNIALVDSLSPQADAAPVSAMAPPAYAQNQPRTLVPSAQVSARALPAPSSSHVVMEAVPFDSKAGPVQEATHTPRQLSAAHHARHVAVVRHHAAQVAVKPAVKPVAVVPRTKAKVAAVKKDAPPPLRMTADAGTP